MDHSNKYSLAFDLDSTFAFTFNNRNVKAQSSQKNICLVSSSLSFSVIKRYLELNRFSGSKFPMLKDEIKYYSEQYKRVGEDIQEVCQYNSEVSADKKFVSKIWKDIPTALNEMTAEYIIHLMKLKYS